MTWVIKTKPGCPWCDKAKEELAKLGEEVIEQKHETPLEIGAFKNAGFKTFPQIFHNGNHVGGYTDLMNYLKYPEKDDF